MYRLSRLFSIVAAISSLIVLTNSQAEGRTPAGDDGQGSIDILYTGRLLGYYRLPETQSGEPTQAFSQPFEWCHDARAAGANMSQPASQLFNTLQTDQYKGVGNRLLLGTGDNFALELPARVFNSAPTSGSITYEYSKDQFNWDWEEVSPGVPRGWVLDGQDSSKEEYILHHGFQVIPTDNVACFLSRAGYDAIVPGRHDFYYGPERVRSLARLLASMNDDKFHPVQMLAANLLIKSSWITNHSSIPDSQKSLLPFDVAKEDSIRFPKDGSEVLPWFSRIEVQSTLGTLNQYRVVLIGPEKDPDKESLSVQKIAGNNVTQLQPGKDEFCWFFEGADSGKIPWATSKNQCPQPVQNQESDKMGGLGCEIRPDQQNAVPDSTLVWCFLNPVKPLVPGNYKVCIWPSTADGSRPQCSRFTVAVPFLQYPDPYADVGAATLPPAKKDGTSWQPYATPNPYLVKEVCDRNASGKCTGQRVKVAVFGVVDTDLPQQVGEINGSWLVAKNDEQHQSPDSSPAIDKQRKMGIKTADAAKAVKQLMDYWEDCLKSPSKQDSYCYDDYPDDYPEQHVRYKVLLAQMSPEKASQLTAQLKRRYHFDVVITDHDPEQFTRDQITILAPTLMSGSMPNRDADCPIIPAKKDSRPCNVPSFVVVPPPAWDDPWDDPRQLEGAARLLRLSTLENNRMEYVISSAQRAKTGDTSPLKQAAKDLLPDERSEVRQRTLVLKPQEPVVSLTTCLGDFKNSLKACLELRDIAGAVLKKTIGQHAAIPGDPEKALRQATLATLLKNTHADVAMLQEIDFWFGGDLTPRLLESMADPQHDQDTLQKLLDIILWKGDSYVVLPVRGSVLQAVMKHSSDYDSADNSGLSRKDDRGRGVLTLGIQGGGTNYSINDMPLDPNRVYSVVTTDYIGSGDTAYPEFNDPNVNPPRPFFGKKFTYISSAVCDQYDASGSTRCSSTVNSEKYFDAAALLKPELLPGSTWPHQFWLWWPFRHSLGQGHPRTTSPGKETPIDPERWAQEYPMWRISLDKASLGFSIQRHSDSQADLNTNFGGVATSQALAPTSHNWTTDLEMTFLKSYSSLDFFLSPALLYTGTFTEAKQGGFRNPSQSVDTLTLDSGLRFHLRPAKRQIPHWSLETGLHFETQPFSIVQSLSLPANPLPLQFDLPRTYTRLGRVGIKYDRKSYFEIGLQGGGQFGAFKEFDFPGTSVKCAPSATQTLQQCVSAKADGVIKSSSQVNVLQESRYRTGIFWHSLLVLPAGQRMSASLENQGQFFFNNSGDNSTDTRLQHLVTAKVSFPVWQAISISPTYQFFYYENKLAYKSLWQQQALLTLDYRFDWTNKQITRSQLEYKSSQAPSK